MQNNNLGIKAYTDHAKVKKEFLFDIDEEDIEYGPDSNVLLEETIFVKERVTWKGKVVTIKSYKFPSDKILQNQMNFISNLNHPHITKSMGLL